MCDTLSQIKYWLNSIFCGVLYQVSYLIQTVFGLGLNEMVDVTIWLHFVLACAVLEFKKTMTCGNLALLENYIHVYNVIYTKNKIRNIGD